MEYARANNIKFLIIFILEFVLLAILIVWAFKWIIDQAKLVELISSILFSFGAMLLTTAIVYHHFWLHPELKFTGVTIEPLDANKNNITQQRFRTPVYRRIVQYQYQRMSDNIKPDIEGDFKVIETVSPCSEIRVADDICNIGGNRTKLHEYCVTRLKPTKQPKETYIFRCLLENEQRETIDFIFPAGNGEFEFEIEVIASTIRKSHKVKIEISNNLKNIRWK